MTLYKTSDLNLGWSKTRYEYGLCDFQLWSTAAHCVPNLFLLAEMPQFVIYQKLPPLVATCTVAKDFMWINRQKKEVF